ncbi:MAG: beta-N-acetylhexosaminidase [Alphaproteobacteria bacterium CG_4_10_14_0_8_um_filter_53_9]|nr:MAG: beta-N-acetylhexosaminidase [Alphaproteobacteria bacterium CG_4_10_14_0_8_um_filter_53_9]
MSTPFSPLIVGVEGLKLTPVERVWLADVRPYAVVLFARNIAEPSQLLDLVGEIKTAVPDVRLVVDQEGGRVQRLTFDGPLPSAAEVGARWAGGATMAGFEWGYQIGESVAKYGFDWVFAPCVDRRVPGAHAIIGDRAISEDVGEIVRVASDFLDGLKHAKVEGCLKHVPGHGRATVDSHHGLPVVRGTDEEMALDFKPFKTLATKAGFVMTAHIAYPDFMGGIFGELPVTMNADFLTWMRDEMNFAKGKIVADDMGMEALGGDYASRVRGSLEAGCDLVCCSFSLIKKGMAGSYFDSEAAAAVRGMRFKV